MQAPVARSVPAPSTARSPCGGPSGHGSGRHYDAEEPNAASAAFRANPKGRGFPGAWHCCSAGRCDPASACAALGRDGARKAAFCDGDRVACGCSRTRPAATESQPPRYRLHLASRHAAPERGPRGPRRGIGQRRRTRGRAYRWRRCIRFASLRTCRGATLRDPSRKAAVRPRSAEQGPLGGCDRGAGCSAPCCSSRSPARLHGHTFRGSTLRRAPTWE